LVYYIALQGESSCKTQPLKKVVSVFTETTFYLCIGNCISIAYKLLLLRGLLKGHPLTINSVKIGGVYLDFNTLQGLAR